MKRLVHANPGSALILSAGDRILRSRTLTSGQQLEFARKWEKNSSPQNGATSTLQARPPQS